MAWRPEREMKSMVERISDSLMEAPNWFQDDHPIGGVFARLLLRDGVMLEVDAVATMVASRRATLFIF